MSHDRSRIDRRTVLGTLGTGTVLALAGCMGDDDADEPDDDADESDDDAGTEDGTGPDESDGTDEDGGTEQLDAPVEVPDEEPCAVCNMVAAEHPDWNAQLVHENEERAFFCSSGCLSAYNAAPRQFDGPDSPVANAWVTGFESRELVDAAEAYFVRVTNADHVDDIMMMNPTPFANREDAEAFVGEFEQYSEEDIIGFEDFDMDLAMLYREKFFDEETA
jgi:nitrous oxide reductase accessory protein NosL